MYKEVLTPAQIDLLPFIKKLKRNFYLVGGTAIALQLGHRRSIDFDLFTKAESLDLKKIKNEYKGLQSNNKHIVYEAFDQLHITVEGVKITFFTYPYPVHADVYFDDVCTMPTLLSLSAMKVFALGGRAKWKDYVDLFYILKSHHTLQQISDTAAEIFGDMFSPKLLRQQLPYFDDIDYSEEVEFIGEGVSQKEVKDFLMHIATEKF